jgi:asparagine synthase (glutamine-hydrolysing)
MIELHAVHYFDTQTPAQGRTSQLKYCKAWTRGGLAMRVEGDHLVDSFVFDSPELSLICRADLLNREQKTSAAQIAALYLRQGDDFAVTLRGTFAVILFDHRTRKLKAWTDHFGSERLVYTESPELTAVSTDLGSLLALQTPQPDLNLIAIQEYLQYSCIPTPQTIYKGYFRVPPGHQWIGGSQPVTRSYWDMTFEENSAGSKSEESWAAETRNAIQSAVALNIKGVDEPSTLGCFLSGGTDSSSIAGLVGQLTGKRPRTFSIGFDDPRYNEMQYARIAATRYNADHHEYFVKPADILSLLNRAADAYDEPFGNSSIIPTYFCARLAAENGITHMLAGDGGDELFGGNSRYTSDRLFQRYHSLPLWLRRGIVEPAIRKGLAPGLAAKYVKRSSIGLPDRLLSYSLLASVPSSDLFSNEFLQTIGDHHFNSPARRHYSEAPSKDELNRWLYLDLKITITDNDLRKVTPMTQLAGVTVRYPLLDPTLAEFTGTMPPKLKVKKSQLRYLFKKAMSEVLPPEILTKKKHGFGLPYAVWVGEDKPLRDFTFDVLGSPRCRQRGYFRRDLLEWIWSKYETEHRGYYGEILWVFLMLELWHVVHRDHPASVPERAELERISFV